MKSILVLFLFSSAAFAQSSATISGVVTDAQGAVISGAAVTDSQFREN